MMGGNLGEASGGQVIGAQRGAGLDNQPACRGLMADQHQGGQILEKPSPLAPSSCDATPWNVGPTAQFRAITQCSKQDPFATPN